MNAQLQQRLKRLKTLPVFPTLLTAGNLACGITAVLCAAHYTPSDTSHQWMLFIGAGMVFAAMVFDMFDGKVARLMPMLIEMIISSSPTASACSGW